MYGRGYVSYGLITTNALTNKGRYRAARAAKNGSEGAKSTAFARATNEIRGPIAKNGFSGQNPKILAQKKNPLLTANHVPATTGQ